MRYQQSILICWECCATVLSFPIFLLLRSSIAIYIGTHTDCVCVCALQFGFSSFRINWWSVCDKWLVCKPHTFVIQFPYFRNGASKLMNCGQLLFVVIDMSNKELFVPIIAVICRAKIVCIKTANRRFYTFWRIEWSLRWGWIYVPNFIHCLVLFSLWKKSSVSSLSLTFSICWCKIDSISRYAIRII